MPDLPNRQQAENDLAAALYSLFQDQLSSVEHGSISWPAAESRMKAAVADKLAVVFLTAARQLAEESGRKVDTDKLAAEASNWGQEYAASLAEVVTATTRERVAAAVDRAALLAIFSVDRASSIAITETTRAVTAGEQFLILGLMILGEDEPDQIWRTSLRANVCSICSPLNGEPRRVWEAVAPDGPPAHPSCNCYLDIEL